MKLRMFISELKHYIPSKLISRSQQYRIIIRHKTLPLLKTLHVWD